MRMLIQNNDVKEVFKVLRREGSKDPELYVQVLTYFVQQSIVPESGGYYSCYISANSWCLGS